MSMSKLAPPNPNAMPDAMVAHLVKLLGNIKVVYLTTNGPTEDQTDPRILGTFYSLFNLPDGVVQRLDAALRAIDESRELSKVRMSMGNKLERRYALFGKAPYTFSGKRHQGVEAGDTQALIDYMADVMQTPFNSILANEYATPGAAISAHSDDEQGVATHNIPGFSVAPRNPETGCEYKFVIRTISKPGTRAKIVFEYKFPPLCLFGMYGQDFQSSFTHAVPAGPAGRGKRTSLTFRLLTNVPKNQGPKGVKLPTKRKAAKEEDNHESKKQVDINPVKEEK